VALLVKKTQYEGPNYIKVRGWWLTTGYPGKVLKLLATPQTITIMRENIPKWKRIDLDVTELLW
jgi:hypothetical protein